MDLGVYLGLTECQARSQEKLDFHVNASVTAVKLGRLVSRRLSIFPEEPSA